MYCSVGWGRQEACVIVLAPSLIKAETVLNPGEYRAYCNVLFHGHTAQLLSGPGGKLQNISDPVPHWFINWAEVYIYYFSEKRNVFFC